MTAADWSAWVRRLFHQPHACAVRRCIRLCLEVLEDRTAPAMFLVTSTGDSGMGSLPYCIVQSNATSGPNVIDFDLGDGPTTIALSSELVITHSVTIDAGSAPITVSGGGSTRVFQIARGVTAAIDNLTITGGYAQLGGAIENDGALQLNGCTLTGNEAYGGDGGSSVNSSGGAGGGGAGMGGAVYNTGTLDLTNCTLTANQAVGGQGGSVNGNFPDVDGLSGGGAAGGTGGTGSTGATVEGPPGDPGNPGAFGGGGGGGGGTHGSGTSFDPSVDVDTPPSGPGGLGGFGGGGGGGGGSPFGFGSAAGGAGGTFGGNGGPAFASWAGGGGGGAGLGGALFNSDGTVTLTNCTLAGNTATGGAGGSSFAAGQAGQGVGGAVFNYGEGTVSPLNTILAGNSSSTQGPDLYGAVNSQGFNLIGDASGADGYVATDLLNVAPGLGTLQDNGGPTQTIALDPDSLAFAAGTAAGAPAVDQRGAPRLGWVNIGAYQDSFLVVNTNDAGAGSLRQAILNANANAGTDPTIQFAIPGEGVQTIAPTSALPTLTADNVVIDGYSQPGASANTLTAGENAVLQIELDGVGAGSLADGLTIDASNCDVKGLVINRFTGSGVSIVGGSGNAIEGDFLGTDPTGQVAEGNGVDGVRIQNGASQNTVGGTTPAARDVIAFNAKGVAVLGASSVGDSILGDRIFGDAGPGIDLGDDGVTPNGTPGPGPNDFQNHPVLLSVLDGQVVGYLNGAANTLYRIEFFATPRSGGSFQGQSFLGFALVSTNAAGLAAINATVTAPPAGWMVTATATDTADGDTSEFSPGPPASATVNGGSGQHATVGTAFDAPLAVLVKDAFGDAVQGITVAFAGPDSGPTATFPDGPSAATDATGVASIAVDAGTVAGAYTTSATVAGLPPLDFSLTNDPGAAATLTVTGGSGQDATVGSDFEEPLTVVVRDQYGNVVPDVSVDFAGPESGAGATFPDGGAAVTDSSGVAEVAVAANTTAGAYAVTATTAGVTDGASFALTNDPGAPASLTVVTGSGQDATVGTDFEAPLVVLVQDQYGNVIPGAIVDFAGPASGTGATFPDSAVTDSSGEAQVFVTANTTAGAYTVTATTTGVSESASFSLTNDPGAAASLTVVSGSGQDATVGMGFKAPLVVLVQDQYGNVIPGATVVFAGPASGPGATFLDSDMTDSTGEAEVAITANTKAGAYTITATTAGVSAGASFSLTNDPGAPASLTYVSGSGQDATVEMGFKAPLVVLVQDQYGNSVPGATVVFAGPASGPGATFLDSAKTDSTGEAEVFVTANTTAGAYTVTATTAGVAEGVSFALTNDPGAAVQIQLTGVPSMIDEQDPVGVGVQLLDAYGNIATGFRGTVHFSSDDPRAVLPDDYTFTAADAGVHGFLGLRLITPGSQTLSVTAPGLAAGSASVQVSDVAPTVTLNQALVSVPVGATLQSTGQFIDPDGSTWTATVDYGDGGGAQPLALAADKTFQLQHVYQTEGNYTVTVVVTDESGVSSAPDTLLVKALGAPPAVTLNDSLLRIDVGAPLQSGGEFTDPDASSWTATVNYDDGGGPQPLALAADKTFQLQHLYQTEGNYTVTVVVTDHSGVSSAPATLEAAVFIAGTNSSGVGVAQASPGTSSTTTAPGITGTVFRNSSDPGDGTLLVTPLPPQAVGTATVAFTVPSGAVTAASYDVRGVSLLSDDVVIVTLSYSPDGVAPDPILHFFDSDTGTFRIVPTIVNAAKHTVTAIINRDSDPSVTELNGTVFTITVTPITDIQSSAVGAFAPATGRPQNGPGATASIVPFVENALSGAVGLATIGTVSAVEGGGSGDDDPTQDARDVLGDLPSVNADQGDSGSPPSTAVLSPSQSTLPDKSAPDKKPGPAKPPGSDKPKPPAPGKSNAPPAGAAVAPARPTVVQRTGNEEAAPARRRPSASFAVHLVLVAVLFLALPDDRRWKDRGL